MTGQIRLFFGATIAALHISCLEVKADDGVPGEGVFSIFRDVLVTTFELQKAPDLSLNDIKRVDFFLDNGDLAKMHIIAFANAAAPTTFKEAGAAIVCDKSVTRFRYVGGRKPGSWASDGNKPQVLQKNQVEEIKLLFEVAAPAQPPSAGCLLVFGIGENAGPSAKTVHSFEPPCGASPDAIDYSCSTKNYFEPGNWLAIFDSHVSDGQTWTPLDVLGAAIENQCEKTSSLKCNTVVSDHDVGPADYRFARFHFLCIGGPRIPFERDSFVALIEDDAQFEVLVDCKS
ncbi:hypothetical protein [uncultured Tateyamaria sp.]|uniref:hypothetical protein n=1 Tax=uncultured Tateyamaria sp. TaxID=455651 RepID=UPI0026383DE3|nr:hypothetical protein [uncultured Tateyamaria sp.]